MWNQIGEATSSVSDILDHLAMSSWSFAKIVWRRSMNQNKYFYSVLSLEFSISFVILPDSFGITLFYPISTSLWNRYTFGSSAYESDDSKYAMQPLKYGKFETNFNQAEARAEARNWYKNYGPQNTSWNQIQVCNNESKNHSTIL